MTSCTHTNQHSNPTSDDASSGTTEEQGVDNTRTSSRVRSLSTASSTCSIALSSTKSLNVFQVDRSTCFVAGFLSKGFSRTVAEGLWVGSMIPFTLSSECWLPNSEESDEVWWNPGGTSCAPSDSRTVSRAEVRSVRMASHSCRT